MPDQHFPDYGGPMRRRRQGDPGQAPTRPPPPQPPRRLAPRRQPRRSPWLGVVAAILMIAAFPFALPYLISEAVYRDQILPGVRVQSIELSGLSRASAADELARRYGSFLLRPLTLIYGERLWTPTLEQLGVQFSPASAAETAFRFGRSGDPLARLQAIWQLWNGGVEVPPRIGVDAAAMQGYLATVAAELERPPESALISIANARVVGVPSTPGLQLLADQTAGEIMRALSTLEAADVPIRTRELPAPVGDAALIIAQQQVQDLISTPLVLREGEREWVWEPARLAELLTIAPQDGALHVAIDELKLGRAIEQLAQSVDTGSAEPRLRFENGGVQIVEPGQPGLRLDHRATFRAISETLALATSAQTRTVLLATETITPQITADNLRELGIVELVGSGQSSFAGSAQYRITNIIAGARRMDGVLIPPGEEFSFNTQLGAVDAANGFVEGYAIIGNRTQLEWGGGVCQDSTTVFRAAFWAGLPITERHAHTFYISWYDRFGLGPNGDGQGLDAAIFTGVQDLRFLNDTGNWLLMQTEINEFNQTLTVNLYGTKPNREVRLVGPTISNEVPAPREPVFVDDPTRPAGTVYQSDVARGGRDILIERVIIEDGVEVRRDEFFTRFKAWPNVFVRGTGS